MNWQVLTHDYLGLVVGLALSFLGVAMIAAHHRNWGRQQSDVSLSEEERSYFANRYRRRMQTSSLLIVIGLMIAIGDTLIPWKQAPGMFVAYWGLILALAIWVILLALADLASTSQHAKLALQAARTRQQELKSELAEFARTHRNSANETRSPEQSGSPDQSAETGD